MTVENDLEQGLGAEPGTMLGASAPANPIDIASKASIDELFSMDPQFYTEENLATIVERLRAGRGKWLQESKGFGNRSTGRGKTKLSTEQAMNLLNNLVIDI